jgi:hypothetical protein
MYVIAFLCCASSEAPTLDDIPAVQIAFHLAAVSLGQLAEYFHPAEYELSSAATCRVAPRMGLESHGTSLLHASL